jgi:hypothetical protein
MRKQWLYGCIVLIVVLLLVQPQASAQTHNSLTQKEKMEGWKLLFDGKTFSGWTMLAGKGWEIVDGNLNATPFDDKIQKDIITHSEYENFELVFEFRVFKMTNSGVKYLVTNNFDAQKGVYLGLEYQILDDVNFHYPERGELRTNASLYDLIPANKEKTAPSMKWNKGKIKVAGNHVQHWLNGKIVVQYDRSTGYFDDLLSKSKYKNLTNFGKMAKGVILLQNEGTPVSFRNIKIRGVE